MRKQKEKETISNDITISKHIRLMVNASSYHCNPTKSALSNNKAIYWQPFNLKWGSKFLRDPRQQRGSGMDEGEQSYRHHIYLLFKRLDKRMIKMDSTEVPKIVA